MAVDRLPASAAWRHEVARAGFESVFLAERGADRMLVGHTAAVEGDDAWAVHYEIVVDDAWRTRSARVAGWTEAGRQDVAIDGDGAGRWRVNGVAAPELDGCLDIDLESSACTNTLPVHRLELAVGQTASAPAAYVRALDLGVERLEQHYARVDDDRDQPRYDYSAPVLAFHARLVYDTYGLVVEYPGIARRVL
jgi:hypothetical protein